MPKTSLKQSDTRSVKHNSPVALLLIDVINDFNFSDNEQILINGLTAAKQLASVKRQCSKVDIPTIYANDNFGIWRSDFKSVVNHCTSKSSAGHKISTLLRPTSDDYFVLKPKHSGFFSTTLDVLLQYLNVKKLIIGGFAGNICVLFTANDAYMREYKLFVPADCSASNTMTENEQAMKQMKSVLKANIEDADKLLENQMFKISLSKGRL